MNDMKPFTDIYLTKALMPCFLFEGHGHCRGNVCIKCMYKMQKLNSKAEYICIRYAYFWCAAT